MGGLGIGRVESCNGRWSGRSFGFVFGRKSGRVGWNRWKVLG